MRERPDGDGESSAGEEVGKRRIDLTVPQVAGSAVAAVVAAKLASYFGVYGTILGAGLVSVVATCGGPVLQHFFRRTGEQLREKAVAARPVAASVPAGRTPPPLGEFTEGTVYRARVRSWKRPVLAAALVFGVTMAGITGYELVSGNTFSGGRGTTVGDAVSNHRSPSSQEPGAPAPPSSPTQTPWTGTDAVTPQGGSGSGRTDSGTEVSPTPAPEPTGSAGSTGADNPAGTGTGAPTPAPTATATAPAPAEGSRSGTGVGDPAGPAAP
ncbi:hypothetical protein C1I97_08430 [Streptomyces sp. NTH33]|uniref:hypothetical protein n=1 Tax=Streptomyces sp. NTH33 TaxID=1735453 RepID=UPI000DA99114|nr:hypothetical protein [Streptomyces sp. NTH33]PZH15348.1 hypothetical protein C1I97_08430 [Streptomyces sp. NTH33]